MLKKHYSAGHSYRLGSNKLGFLQTVQRNQIASNFSYARTIKMTTAFQLLNCLPTLFDVFYLYVMHKNATITNSILYREVFTDIQSGIMLLQTRNPSKILLYIPWFPERRWPILEIDSEIPCSPLCLIAAGISVIILIIVVLSKSGPWCS